MQHILIAGGGKIGCTIAHLLANSGLYHVTIFDQNIQPIKNHFGNNMPGTIELLELDIDHIDSIKSSAHYDQTTTIISCLPYFLNKPIAKFAGQNNLNYFDLTEDRETADYIDEIAQKSLQVFVPQCGVAPGLVNIVSATLMQQLDEVHDVKLRCGALPMTTNNSLKYALSWSPDGLINEYGNPCQAIANGQQVESPALGNLETIQIEGETFEAFNTSGGSASLVEEYAGKVHSLNYKTMRYPGHCEKMRFLMQELKLNDDRKTLKRILLNAIPFTQDDMVIVYIAVKGLDAGALVERDYIHKFYPHTIDNIHYTGIQMVTATCACAVLDIVLSKQKNYRGRIHQHQFTLNQLLQSPLAEYLRTST